MKNLITELAPRQTELGLEVSVISCSEDFGMEAEQKDFDGVPIYLIHPKGQVEELLRKIAPDVLHANGEKALFARLCKKLGIRCIIRALHGGILCPAGTLLNTRDEICHCKACFKNCLPCYLKNIRTGQYWYPFMKLLSEVRYLKLGKRLENRRFIPFITPIGEAAVQIEKKATQWRTILDGADRFIAPSNAIAEAMIRNGADGTEITVQPHGIPLPKTNTDWPITENGIKFYYVGRICHVKGIHIMLEAWSKIKNESIELHLIGGTGNKAEKRYLEQLQRKYRNDKRIIWHGKKSSAEIPEMVSQYHVMLHPAIFLEVFGISIAEAISQGKFVIATRCGGAEMQITENENGWLIEPNSVEAMRTAIERYIANPLQSSNSSVLSIAEYAEKISKIYHDAAELN